MKTPEWIKQYWKDPVFRVFTIAVPIVAVVWDVLCTIVNYAVGEPGVSMGTTILGLTVLIIMYTIAYFKRNSP